MICPICGEAELKVGLGRTAQHGVKEVEAVYCPKCNATFELTHDTKKELEFTEMMEREDRLTEYKGSNLAQYNYLKARLEMFEKEMSDKEVSAWTFPRCPQCSGVLSQYTFTSKVICLECGSIYALGWCEREKPAIENVQNEP